MSLVQTNTTFASIELLLFEVSNLGLSKSDQVLYLHNQSKEEAQDEVKYEVVLFTQLKGINLAASEGIYTSPVSWYCFKKVDKDEFAIDIFEEMESKGCRSILCIDNVLIKMHGNQGKVADMMSVFGMLKSNVYTPLVIT